MCVCVCAHVCVCVRMCVCARACVCPHAVSGLAVLILVAVSVGIILLMLLTVIYCCCCRSSGPRYVKKDLTERIVCVRVRVCRVLFRQWLRCLTVGWEIVYAMDRLRSYVWVVAS